MFRVRSPRQWFDEVAGLGPDRRRSLGGRRVWRCRQCGQVFALMRIAFKDEEDILVRAPDGDWSAWDWASLADAASHCRWRGPKLDEEHLL